MYFAGSAPICVPVELESERLQQQALEREGAKLTLESAATRDRYGRGPWGHYTLLARRLVEAGVSFVTVDMPHWDDHSGIEKGHGYKLPVLDAAVGALMQDLADRSLLQDVLVIVMGEMGRTPRVNAKAGRDHWPQVWTVWLAGVLRRRR